MHTPSCATLAPPGVGSVRVQDPGPRHGLAYDDADLPPTIQRALSRVSNRKYLNGLNSSERGALEELLRRVDKNDGEQRFWVKRFNMAQLFGVSVRTVSNWLNALEIEGMVTKVQGRRDWGEYGNVVLQLTPEAIGFFGLDEPLRAPKKAGAALDVGSTISTQTVSETLNMGLDDGQDGEANAEWKNSAPGLCSTAFEQSSSSKKRHPELSTTPGLLENSGHSRIQNRVPEDCRSLLDSRINFTGVFKLMKAASQNGKRLGDIVSARGAAIREARSPYSFVFKLIQDPLDYAAIRRNQVQAESEKSKIQQEEAQRQANRERWSGQWVALGPDPLNAPERIHVDTSGMPQVHVMRNGQWSFSHALCGSAMTAFWQGQGRWADLQLVPYDAPEEERRKAAGVIKLRTIRDALKASMDPNANMAPRMPLRGRGRLESSEKVLS